MTPAMNSLLWCVLQVTLFSVLGGALYLILRRVSSVSYSTLLASSLWLILVLTLLAGSPWPRWDWQTLTPPEPVTSQSNEPSKETNPASIPSVENLKPSTDSLLKTAWNYFTLALTQTEETSPVSNDDYSQNSINILGLLLVGCLLTSLARLAWGIQQVEKLRRHSHPIDDSSLIGILVELRAKLSLKQNVDLCMSSKIATPATIGWKRPCILLPQEWADWSPDELRTALAHELSHVAAKDYRSWIIGRLAVAIHFYHPLVRWLSSRLQLEQELAADAAAAQLVGDRQIYLQNLAALALKTPHHRLASPARTLIPSRSLLVRRVEMLRTAVKSYPNSNSSRRIQGISVGLVLILAVVIAGFRQPTTSFAEETSDTPRKTATAFPSANRLPLSLVPTESVCVMSVRPAELLADPSFDPLVKGLEELMPIDFKKYSLSIRDFGEIMLSFQASDNNHLRTVFRCVSSDSSLALTQALLGRPPEQSLDTSIGSQVFQQPSQRITRLDDKTIVVEPHSSKNPNGEGLPPLHTQTTHPWADQWEQSKERHLLAALSFSALRNAMSPDARDRMLRSFPMQAFGPVLDGSDWSIVSLAIGDQLNLQVLLQSNSVDNANNTADILRASLVMAKAILKQKKAALYDQLEQDTSQPGAKPWKPLADQAFALGDDFTSNATITTSGNRVQVIYQSKQVSAQYISLFTQTMLPAVHSARNAAKKTVSLNNMKQLVIAMLNYEDSFGRFPSSVLYKEGSPHPYSWRVALLPFLNQQALYDQYRFDEPWDSEANKKLLEIVVPVYQSPADDPASTNASYFVLVGPQTVFSSVKGTKISDIRDGMSRTWMIVEAKRGIPWTKPEDITYDENKPLPAFGGWFPDIFQVAYCDGHIETKNLDTEESLIRAAISKAGKD